MLQREQHFIARGMRKDSPKESKRESWQNSQTGDLSIVRSH